MGGGKAPMAFLNKKSWHVTTLKNVEQVWKAEQAERIEAKKTKMLQKQLADERTLDELRSMRGDSKASGLEWMRAAPTQQTSAEDYLTGKVKAPEVDKDDYAKMKESGAAGSLLTPQSSGVAATANVRDMVRKIREDPVMLIKQKEKEAREALLSNPVMLARLKAELELRKQQEEKSSGRSDGHRHHHRRHHHHKDRESGDRDSRRKHGDRDRSRDRSRDRDGRDYRHDDASRPRHRSRSRGSSSGTDRASRSPPRASASSSAAAPDPVRAMMWKAPEKPQGERVWRNGDRAASSGANRMSAEERERKLQQMSLDAQSMDIDRARTAALLKAKSEKEKEQERAQMHSKEKEADFLAMVCRVSLQGFFHHLFDTHFQVHKTTFMAGANSVSDRVAQRAHYR
jgi:hypothetical protein